MDRIATWTDGKQAVFYTKAGNEDVFVPRGVNYIAIVGGSHVLFDPPRYHGNRVDADMKEIASWGYNFVRVFIETRLFDNGFHMQAPGMDRQWLANIADFIMRANRHGLYVVLVSSGAPANYTAGKLANPDIASDNATVLDQTMVGAAMEFWGDFYNELIRIDPVLVTGILATDISNEVTVNPLVPPFSLTKKVTIWGKEYVMSNPVQRQLAVDDGGVAWANAISGVIKSVDNDHLVTTSGYSPVGIGYTQGFNGGVPQTNHNYPLRWSQMVRSGLDFFDYHFYGDKGYPFTVPQELASLEMQPYQNTNKPLVCFETGADKANYPDFQSASAAVTDIMKLLALYRFVGSSFWTWNTPDTQKSPMQFWTLTEQNNAFNSVISPNAWETIA